MKPNFQQEIDRKAKRQLQARKQLKSVWFGLGMFGMVGWSVVIPILMGISLGIWLDKHFPSPYSWTLMLLLLGVVLGCCNAWYWISKESHLK